jgi:hypothetical protein
VQPFRKYCLLNGFDDIGLTLRQPTRSAPLKPSAWPPSPGWRTLATALSTFLAIQAIGPALMVISASSYQFQSIHHENRSSPR